MRSRLWLLAPLAALLMATLAVAHVDAADSIPGSQGTDTSLPLTDSAVVAHGRGDFSNLAITVNQTQNLTNQAVSITWTGGTPTKEGPGRFAGNYLQIMQCWGDDDGTVPGNPGPPPEQCEQGAVAGTFGGLTGSSLYPAGLTLSRIISRKDWPNFDPAVGVLDQRDDQVWLPFRAVDGTVVPIQTDPNFNPAVSGGNFWQNPYYGIFTTNEIAGGFTRLDGSGAELFQVLTGLESSGLGCGQRVQPVDGGDNKIPQCWIVVVPRGAAAAENAGSGFEENADSWGVATSPVSPAAWQNRIAIPIDFNPVDSPCEIGAESRRISGSELALPAVASWQPALCGGGDLPPFAYAQASDGAARQQLVSGQFGAPGMVVVSKPVPDAAQDPASPVLYAPLTLSGLVIGFNIERNPALTAPVEEKQLSAVRVADLNLTPRLVAKLLTQSYRQAVSIVEQPDYEWLAINPAHMGADPDFLRFNPEFELLQPDSDGRGFSGLQLPAGNSDAAEQVWQWVLADPEARAWLDGAPDEWGMKVNPVYATTAAANSTGSPFGQPVPNSFPKADPFCYQGEPRGANNSVVPPPLCGTDWMPYRRGFADAAQTARAASDGARIVENPFPQSSSDAWTRVPPQTLGRRSMLALTDTPSAAQFGLQTARLSRAGDNGDDRIFIAPDAATLTEGAWSMQTKDEPMVLEPSPTTQPPDAYPLTVLTWAAIAPLDLELDARYDYAAFIDYATYTGQLPGLDPGQLPRGYAQLPIEFQVFAAIVAEYVRVLVPGVPDTATLEVAERSDPPESVPEPTDVAEESTTTTSPAAPAPPPTTVRSSRPAATPATTSPTTTPTPPPPSTEATISSEETTTTTVAVVASEPPAPQLTEPVSAVAAVITPIIKVAKSRYAVPGLGVMAMGSALGALEITKRPRRRITGLPDGIPPDDTEPI